MAILLNELLTSHFFAESASFTKSQLKASDDQRCLLQAMMLLDRNYISGFEFKDFSETSLMEYAESIKGCYSDKQSDTLKSTVEYLTDAYPQPNKQLKKISIPMVVYLADVAMDTGVKPMYFRQWWEFFTEEDSLFDDYKLFCSTGSTKLEKVNGRLAVMAKSFCLYNEVEVPEELKDMVAEVEEKIALLKAEREEESVPDVGSVSEEKEGGDAPGTGDTGQEEHGLLEQGEPDSAGQEEAPDAQNGTGAPIGQEPAEIQEEGTGHCEDAAETSDTGEGSSPAGTEG